jgi:hypothetical protein
MKTITIQEKVLLQPGNGEIPILLGSYNNGNENVKVNIRMVDNVQNCETVCSGY